MGRKILDLTNQKFGKLTVKKYAYRKDKNTFWECLCECGNKTIVRASNLRSGTTTSCGCYRKTFKINDLIGKKFGKLTVIERVQSSHKYFMYLCKCDCGKEIIVSRGNLQSGKTKSCGCLRSKNFKDLTGQKFGEWTVLKKEDIKNSKTRWLCRCSCGTLKIVFGYSLTHGLSVSCGCQRNNLLRMQSSTHEGSKTRLYKVWLNMKSRCYNSNNDEYHNYGARGIIVCEEWRNNFEIFRNWALSHGYNKFAKKGECTLDRIDVNGNYEPLNCRWANMKQQMRNTRKTHFITFNGETMCLKDWAKKIGLKEHSLIDRLKRWGNIEKALTTPVYKNMQRK